MKLNFLSVAIISVLFSCSTLSPSERVARDAFIAGTIGYAIGQQSPKNPDLYSAAYGGTGLGLGAMFGLLVHDPEQVPQKVQAENDFLRRQISEMQEPKVLERVPSFARLPRDVQKLVRPGEWKIMQIDEWVEDGENRLVHQDKVVELVPPALVPKGR